MSLFRDLILSASGKAAIVIGGGVDAPSEYSRSRAAFPDAVILSVNEHGFKTADRIDYIVCLDEVNFRIRNELKFVDGKFITYHKWADYRIIEHPNIAGNSGNYAAWIAWNLGAAPIVLCGFDCYSKGTYFHDPKAFSLGNRIPLETHLLQWERTKKLLPDDAPVRVFGEPLSKLFPVFDEKESFADYQLPERHYLLKSQTGKLLRITRPARAGAESFEPGQIVELSRRDAQRLLTNRRAVPVKMSGE